MRFLAKNLQNNFHVITPNITGRASVKIFSKGVWLKKNIFLKDCFLLVLSEKKILEEVILIEGCIVKLRNNILTLIYSTQYDERISFAFDSEIEAIEYSSMLKLQGNIRKFKDFYCFGSKLGQGKFSEVYSATEIATSKQYAVKKIYKRTLEKCERELIRKEISIHSMLNHKGIVKYKEYFDSRKCIILVMELVKGGDLLKKINSQSVNEEEVKKIIREILQTVEYLHGLGIVHRDLKPENVLIDQEGCVKIIDFGLATFVLPNKSLHSSCGTLGYTAPEVFRGRYTAKVDLWSIGVITYAFLIGKLPFFSYIKEEMIEKSCTEEVDFSDEKWEKYSNHAKEFIQTLLVKDPNLRMDCAQALIHPWLC